jgi:hypothetical protein
MLLTLSGGIDVVAALVGAKEAVTMPWVTLITGFVIVLCGLMVVRLAMHESHCTSEFGSISAHSTQDAAQHAMRT